MIFILLFVLFVAVCGGLLIGQWLLKLMFFLMPIAILIVKIAMCLEIKSCDCTKNKKFAMGMEIFKGIIFTGNLLLTAWIVKIPDIRYGGFDQWEKLIGIAICLYIGIVILVFGFFEAGKLTLHYVNKNAGKAAYFLPLVIEGTAMQIFGIFVGAMMK